MFNVDITRKIGDRGMKVLAAQKDIKVTVANSDNPADYMDLLREADGIIHRIPTKLPGELLRQLPRLKVIAHYGVGVDLIDVDAGSWIGGKRCFIKTHAAQCIHRRLGCRKTRRERRTRRPLRFPQRRLCRA